MPARNLICLNNASLKPPQLGRFAGGAIEIPAPQRTTRFFSAIAWASIGRLKTAILRASGGMSVILSCREHLGMRDRFRTNHTLVGAKTDRMNKPLLAFVRL